MALGKMPGEEPASCAGAYEEGVGGEGFQSWRVERMLPGNQPEPFSASLERSRAERIMHP